MATKLSKTKIDQLGERLKQARSDEDIRLLDEYRFSFGEAYETVISRVRGIVPAPPSGRPVKTTDSIVDKLRRESIRLTQMQDIAGCRVVVEDIAEQNRSVAALIAAFPMAAVMDRRVKPSYGYRAVHVIPKISGKPVEIQVRTILQDLWAKMSERASDTIDQNLKYGGGPPEWLTFLDGSSKGVASLENSEVFIGTAEKAGDDIRQMLDTEMGKSSGNGETGIQEVKSRLADLDENLAKAKLTLQEEKKAVMNIFAKLLSLFDMIKKQQL